MELMEIEANAKLISMVQASIIDYSSEQAIYVTVIEQDVHASYGK
jgi:hypothetical protein